MSDSEDVYKDVEEGARQLADSDRDIDDYDEEGDPEVGIRGDGQVLRDDDNGEAPSDEDLDKAGYGGNDQLGPERAEERLDDDEEGQMMEIGYNKDEGDYDNWDEGGDDGGHRESSKKKKKGDKGDKMKKKKKIKRDYGDEAEEDPDIEDEFDRGTKKAGRRNKDDKLTDVEVDDLQRLVRDMELAYVEDIENLKNKQPAMNKLRLLPRIENSLRRGAAQKEFIDKTEGLDAIAKWLTKLPNGATPALQIKKKFADVLFHLPVTDEHLRTSDIGKVVYQIKSNPHEEAELRNSYKLIVDKWTRLLTDSAHDYSEHYEQRDRRKINVSLDDFRQRGMSDLRKSIPRMVNKRSGFDFAVRLEEKKGLMRNTNARQQSNEECDKLIKDMKRKMRKEFK